MTTPRSARHGVVGERLDLRHIGKMATCVIAALLSVSILVAFGWGWKNYRDLNAGLHTFKLNSLNRVPTTGTSGGATTSIQKDGQDQNILIVGLDDRTGLTPAQEKEYHTGNDATDSTDSIMIVHVPADGEKATLISIPRETYVDIPGYKKNLINAAYADAKYDGASGTLDEREGAGFDLLVSTVENLTGVSINHFVAIGFSGFVKIADAINGVEVNLCYAQNDPYSGLHITAGKHRLVGAQALAFVRQRHNITGGQGDLTRVERQRYFLAAAFNQIVSLGVLTSPTKISNLISAIKSSIFVDSDNFSLVDLAEQLADLTAGNIIGHTIPTEGDVTTIEGQDGLAADPAKVAAQVALWLNPPATTTPTSTPSSGTSTGSTSPTSTPSTSSSAALSKGCIH
jgi:LCP family protein required for cell wall assembly